jgi:hypothetical protein
MHPAALTFNVTVAPHRLSDVRRTAGRTVCQAQSVEVRHEARLSRAPQTRPGQVGRDTKKDVALRLRIVV